MNENARFWLDVVATKLYRDIFWLDLNTMNTAGDGT